MAMKDWKDPLGVVELVVKLPLVLFGGYLAFYVSCNKEVLEPARQPITMQTNLAVEVVSRHDRFLTVKAELSIVNTGSRAVELLPSMLVVSVRPVEFMEQEEADFDERVKEVLTGGQNDMAARWTRYGEPRVDLVRKVYDFSRLESGEARSKEFLFKIPVDDNKSLRAIVVLPAVADSAGMSVVWNVSANGDIKPDYHYSAIPNVPGSGRLLKPKESKYDAQFLEDRKFRAFSAIVEIPLWPAEPQPMAAGSAPR